MQNFRNLRNPFWEKSKDLGEREREKNKLGLSCAKLMLSLAIKLGMFDLSLLTIFCM